MNDTQLIHKTLATILPNRRQDDDLTKLQIKNVAVMGLTASGSVGSTAATAYNRGYKVTVLSDCLADTSKTVLEGATTFGLKQFSRVTNAKQFLADVES